MPENEGRNPESTNAAQPVGGAYAQGPKPDPGGDTEAGGLVPPYRTDEGDAEGGVAASKEARAEGVKQMLRGEEAAEEPVQPQSSAGTEGEGKMAPEGVGESIGRRGEDMAKHGEEPGRHDEGTKGESERPVGSSSPRDVTGVDPK